MDIQVVPLAEDSLKEMPENFVFGRNFANRMFTQRYHADKGWHDAKIDRYGSIELEPAAAVFHYGQELFEGTKAYRRPDGNVNLFRTIDNAKRFNDSAKRISMPQVDPEFHVDAIAQLVQMEAGWVPDAPGAMYIRPTLIATAPQLGLAASPEYLHFIIVGPVGNYFAQGLRPLPVWIETEYVRAVPGGTGNVKVGGNYAAAVHVSEQAKEKGYAQVLWLDGKERKYVEEVGAMNIAFVYNNKHIITPELSGSILPGITRDSILRMAPDMGFTVEEARIDINDVLRDIESGEITEAFGMGTAAVVAPVGELGLGDKKYAVGKEPDKIGSQIRKQLMDIQFGRIPDPYGWTYTIEVD